MKLIQPFADSNDTAPYTVQYLPYDSALSVAFEEVKRLVQSVAGAILVEHVGSSSVPGLGGRNALDVAIPLAEEAQPTVRSHLYELGFQDSPFPHYLPLLVGRLSYRNTQYPVLLYLVSPQASVYRDWLTFRDYMRSQTADAFAYDAVKRQVAAPGAEGERYQEAKGPFLAAVSDKIRDWAASRESRKMSGRADR